MNKKRLFALLTPSLLSALVVGGMTAIFVFSAIWPSTVSSGKIYDFLLGDGSSSQLVQSTKSEVSFLSETILGNPTLNKVLYFGLWMLIGLASYLILFTVIKSLSNTVEEIDEATYTNTGRTGGWRAIVLRLGLRLTALLIWLVYILCFVKVILPLAVGYLSFGANNLHQLIGWIYLLLGAVIILLSLHIHIICARLLALRVRVFSAVP